MRTLKKYLSLIKFSHTIFAMPFALIGFTIGVYEYTSLLPGRQRTIFPAQGDGNALGFKFILVILCMVFARSAAMAFNRFLDRHFDARNPRTAIREIPAGILKANQVLWFTIVNCLLFMGSAFFINQLCFYLSPLALLVVLGYSYTKRFTPFCHLILGVGLSLAPIGSYLAITGTFALLPVLFSIIVLFWVSGFDIIYALQDEEFDRKENLYSIPAWLGKRKGLQVSRIFHLLSLCIVILAGWQGEFNWLYWMGSGVFGGMLFYQHSLVKPDDLRRVNLAFMTANGFASVVFAIFVIADIFLLQ